MEQESEIFEYYKRLKNYAHKVNDPEFTKLLDLFMQEISPYLTKAFDKSVANKYNIEDSMEGEEKMEPVSGESEKKQQEEQREKENIERKTHLPFLRISLDDLLDFIAKGERPTKIK
jgi:hypothetical protein